MKNTYLSWSIGIQQQVNEFHGALFEALSSCPQFFNSCKYVTKKLGRLATIVSFNFLIPADVIDTNMSTSSSHCSYIMKRLNKHVKPVLMVKRGENTDNVEKWLYLEINGSFNLNPYQHQSMMTVQKVKATWPHITNQLPATI